MATIEYYFDDLQILPGCNVVASGIADVNFRLEPPDPDSGWPRWSLGDVEILGIALDPLALNEKGLMLDTSHPLYKIIEEALLRNDNWKLLEACLNHADD
jgi:hypothetical protein